MTDTFPGVKDSIRCIMKPHRLLHRPIDVTFEKYSGKGFLL